LTIDAVLVTIVNRGQVICKITQVAVKTKLIAPLFYRFIQKTPPNRPQPTPSKEVTCIGLGGSIESMPPEGQTAHYGDDVCGLVVLVVNSTFCTISTTGISQSGSFLFPMEPL
jgi:hypothetical protein